MSDEAPDFYDEDDQGRPRDGKGNIWIECTRCDGEGSYEYLEGDGSDWGEDCPSEENHIIPCRDCHWEGGWWVKEEVEPEIAEVGGA